MGIDKEGRNLVFIVGSSGEGFVRKVGDTRRWREKLSFYQRFWVWRVAGKEMKEVGYEWKWPW